MKIDYGGGVVIYTEDDKPTNNGPYIDYGGNVRVPITDNNAGGGTYYNTSGARVVSEGNSAFDLIDYILDKIAAPFVNFFGRIQNATGNIGKWVKNNWQVVAVGAAALFLLGRK